MDEANPAGAFCADPDTGCRDAARSGLEKDEREEEDDDEDEDDEDEDDEDVAAAALCARAAGWPCSSDCHAQRVSSYLS